MTEIPSFNTIDWSRAGPALILTLNRPEQHNAITQELSDELHAALDLAVEDSEVRAIVLTGSGSAFCSGYDLVEDAEAQSDRGRVRDEVMRLWDATIGPAAARYLSLMRLDKPVIAAVNGWCLGGGLWYALCADITIASERAVFGQPEVRENQNSTFLLAALAGWKNAHRYALTGDHFDAR